MIQNSDPPPILPERPAANTPQESHDDNKPAASNDRPASPVSLDLSNDTIEAKKPYYPDVYNADILQIRKVITEINFNGRVYNSEIFDRDSDRDPVFVIQ